MLMSLLCQAVHIQASRPAMHFSSQAQSTCTVSMKLETSMCYHYEKRSGNSLALLVSPLKRASLGMWLHKPCQQALRCQDADRQASPNACGCHQPCVCPEQRLMGAIRPCKRQKLNLMCMAMVELQGSERGSEEQLHLSVPSSTPAR